MNPPAISKDSNVGICPNIISNDVFDGGRFMLVIDSIYFDIVAMQKEYLVNILTVTSAQKLLNLLLKCKIDII